MYTYVCRYLYTLFVSMFLSKDLSYFYNLNASKYYNMFMLLIIIKDLVVEIYKYSDILWV